ncbi:LOW QUALITY PROTEIN: hypothetical protein HID58_003129, partial [Brassica napus]
LTIFKIIWLQRRYVVVVTGLTFPVEAEERRTNLHLREEQDAAYRAALEADQARESQRQEEEERLEREAAEERKTARVRMRPEKALSLGANLRNKFSSFSLPFITFSVLLLLDIYGTRGLFICRDNVGFGSLGVLETEEYSFITIFPRTVYRRDKESMSLKDAGLHPQASVFIEIH